MGKNSGILDAIKKHEEGAVVMVEVPTEAYFESNIDSLKQLLRQGFDGVYVSFQRPFNNVHHLFKKHNLDTSKLLVVDITSACSGEIIGKHPLCIPVATINVDEIVRAIIESLSMLKSRKRFVFIDSITTIALYQPLSETLRFSEFLVRTVKKHEPGAFTSVIIFNVAKDLAQKPFIRDVALRADEVVKAS